MPYRTPPLFFQRWILKGVVIFLTSQLQPQIESYNSFIKGMNGLRFVYVKLDNEGRQLKKNGNKRKKKGVHQNYLKQRLTMDWRLKQFSRKQGYSALVELRSFFEVDSKIREKYKQYSQQLRKYWGGGKYYKKLGRMDKIKYKQEKQQKGDYSLSNIEKKHKFLNIMIRIDEKNKMEELFIGFHLILQTKKAKRNYQLLPQNSY